MRTNIEFHDCAESENALVREHWANKEAYLDEQLGIGNANPEQSQLNLDVRCEAWATRYAVRAVLALPSGKITAEALDEDVFLALDRVTELLAQAVRYHRGGAPSLAEMTDEVEEASAGSFPASDAPAWTHVTIRN